MQTLVDKFHEYNTWRSGVVQVIGAWHDWTQGARLADAQSESRVKRLLAQLADDKLTVAFVAEFSRGKSELINSIFFADYGQRILPSSAGRTTMCPTELMYDEKLLPSVRLLPIETRAFHASTSEYKELPQEWTVLPLDTSSGTGMLAALQQVSKVKRVPVEDARRYGLYDEDDPHRTDTIDADGLVEVSMWRHAIINFPHPLLRQGLVILDTPGLNAIGSEPELTLSMIPNAHAVLFVLAADTGVTKSDIDIWRHHIGGARKQGRLVVLNKIDSMWDELKTQEQIDAEIERQASSCAQMLNLEARQVFPVSAHKGLLAKVNRDDALLAKSRLLALEAALSNELIPQKQEIITETVRRDLGAQIKSTSDMLVVRGESIDAQLTELRGLRGKSAGVITHMAARLRSEKDDFDKTLLAFQALRAVYAKLSSEVFSGLGLKALREKVRTTRDTMLESAFSLGIRDAMAEFFKTARANLTASQDKTDEISTMMVAMYQKFGAEHGLRVSEPMPLSLRRYLREIDRIDKVYHDRFGMLTILTTEKLVLTQKFFESIATEVQRTYEAANRDVEAWLKAIMAPLEGQIREHQGQLRRRIESVRHIQEANESLEERIGEVEAQESELVVQRQKLQELSAAIEAALDGQQAVELAEAS